MASSHPGSGTASLLSSATYGLSEIAMPWLTAAAKPLFAAIGCHSAPCASATARDPSCEPLSITITLAGCSVCAATPSRQAPSRASPSRFGMTRSTAALTAAS